VAVTFYEFLGTSRFRKNREKCPCPRGLAVVVKSYFWVTFSELVGACGVQKMHRGGNFFRVRYSCMNRGIINNTIQLATTTTTTIQQQQLQQYNTTIQQLATTTTTIQQQKYNTLTIQYN
jgi:hypothetical protein